MPRQEQKMCEICGDRSPGPRYVRGGGAFEHAIRLCGECVREAEALRLKYGPWPQTRREGK